MNPRLLSHAALSALLILILLPPPPVTASAPTAAGLDAAIAAAKSRNASPDTLIELLQRRLDTRGPDTLTLTELGGLFIKTGQWQRAEETAALLQTLNPRPDADIHDLLARAAAGRGDTETELTHLRALQTLLPGNGVIPLRIAEISLARAAFDEALAAATLAASLDPASAAPILIKTRALIALSRWTEAAAASSEAARLDPASQPAALLRDKLQRLGAPSLAFIENTARKMAASRAGAADCLRAASLLQNAGFAQEALPFLRAACNAAPESVIPRLFYARTLADLRQLEKAAPLRVIVTRSNRIPAPALDALLQADARLLANPGDTQARLERATLLNQTGQYLLALDDTAKILQDDPQNALASVEAARALVELQRPKDALPHITQALSLDASNPAAHTLLGRIRLALGEPAAAAQAFQTALSLQPADPGEIRGLLDRSQRILASR